MAGNRERTLDAPPLFRRNAFERDMVYRGGMGRAPIPEAAREAVFDLLERLAPHEAALVRDHMRALAAEAIRQGMLLAGSLMLAARDVAIDFDSVARTLPAMRLYLSDGSGAAALGAEVSPRPSSAPPASSSACR
jgi:hypothetical protein